eukprot:6592780-Prymnesium_polylepis.1
MERQLDGRGAWAVVVRWTRRAAELRVERVALSAGAAIPRPRLGALRQVVKRDHLERRALKALTRWRPEVLVHAEASNLLVHASNLLVHASDLLVHARWQHSRRLSLELRRKVNHLG